MGLIKNVLNFINGTAVVTAGYIWMTISAICCLSGTRRLTFVSLVLVAGISWLCPGLWKWIDDGGLGFADAKRWPAFVCLGVAALASGGAGWCIGGIFCTLDGMYFEQNY